MHQDGASCRTRAHSTADATIYLNRLKTDLRQLGKAEQPQDLKQRLQSKQTQSKAQIAFACHSARRGARALGTVEASRVCARENLVGALCLVLPGWPVDVVVRSEQRRARLPPGRMRAHM